METTFMGFLFQKLYRECGGNFAELSRRLNVTQETIYSWRNSLVKGQLISRLGEALLHYYANMEENGLYKALHEFNAMNCRDLHYCPCKTKTRNIRRMYREDRSMMDMTRFRSELLQHVTNLTALAERNFCLRMKPAECAGCSVCEGNSHECPCVKIHELYLDLLALNE